jgi:hypothetical protein
MTTTAGRTRCQSTYTDWVQVNEFVEDKYLYRCQRLEGHPGEHRGPGERIRREVDLWDGIIGVIDYRTQTGHKRQCVSGGNS